jgi:hypothetical protein
MGNRTVGRWSVGRMKVPALLVFAAAFMLVTVYLWPQGTTPNLGLYQPPINSVGWGASVNNNFGLLDAFSGTVFKGAIYDVKFYGACGNGICDDTAAIQSVINLFTNGRAATASGIVFFPIGTYKITAPLTYVGSPGEPISFVGAGSGEVDTGSELVWDGPSGGTMFELQGANKFNIQDLTFNQANSARIGIHISADNAINTTLGTSVTPGSKTVMPGAMSYIAVGTLLTIDASPNAELVYVTATTGSTFTAIFSKSHSPSAQVGDSAGSSNGVLTRVATRQMPNSATDWYTSPGTASAGIVIGNPTSSGTSQVDTIRLYDPLLYGSGTCSAGIAYPEGGNDKLHWIYNGVFENCQYGVDAPTNQGPLNIIGGSMLDITVADIRLSGFDQGDTIQGVEDESVTGHRFLVSLGGGGGEASQVTLIGNSFQAAAPSDDFVIEYPGAINLVGNVFYNTRTSGSVAKIRLGSPLFGANSSFSVNSSGNFYQNASGYAPFYDTGGWNLLLPTYYNNQPVAVTSNGDSGGVSNPSVVKLNNYTNASIVASQTAAFIPSTGLVRAGDTDTAVAFRNHANSADVNGLSKGATDVITVGDLRGIIVPGPQSSGAMSSPALTVTTLPFPTWNGPQSGSGLGSGTLNANTTYCYQVSALDGAGGETLAWSPERCLMTGAGANTYSVVITWVLLPAAAAYNVYGRTSGEELLMTPTPVPASQTLTFIGYGTFVVFVDTGAATPSGALPSVNTTGAIQTTGQLKSTIAIGTPPISVTSTTPVVNLAATPTTYNAAGTQQTNVHLVKGTCAIGSTCSVTLAGGAVYTSNATYDCWARDTTTSANAVTIALTSGVAVAFTGTGTDGVSFLCLGD